MLCPCCQITKFQINLVIKSKVNLIPISKQPSIISRSNSLRFDHLRSRIFTLILISSGPLRWPIRPTKTNSPKKEKHFLPLDPTCPSEPQNFYFPAPPFATLSLNEPVRVGSELSRMNECSPARPTTPRYYNSIRVN